MYIISKSIQTSLVFFLLLLLFNGCQIKTDPIDSANKEPISYLALGDSYTIGTSIDVQESWPMQLSESLALEGTYVEDTQIIATNGWTTQDLIDGIEEAKPSSDHDLVSLLIGVNNQFQGLDIDLYKTQFRVLLEQAINFAGMDSSRVFVVSIPNYGVTPFGQSRGAEQIRSELVVYNDIAKEISSEYGIPFINITPISELAADDLSLLASDMLHPSAKMYSMWISEMLPIVLPMLSEE